MNNVHRGDGESYHCPDKGNRFPVSVYGGTKRRPTCPGCGADLKTFYARVEASPVAEDPPSPEPAPVSEEPAAVPPSADPESGS